MMNKPDFRFVFLSMGDELNYLNDMIQYFCLHCQSDCSEARAALERFGELLQQLDVDDGSIMLQDHRALLFEMQGDIRAAIMCRKREIVLIDKLFSIGGPVGPVNYAFRSRVLGSLETLSQKIEKGRQGPGTDNRSE